MKLDPNMSNEELEKLSELPQGTYMMAITKPVCDADINGEDVSKYYFKFKAIVLGSGKTCEEFQEQYDYLNGFDSEIFHMILNSEGGYAPRYRDAIKFFIALGNPINVMDYHSNVANIENAFPKNANNIPCVYCIMNVKVWKSKNGNTGHDYNVMSKIDDPEIVSRCDTILAEHTSDEIPF